MTKDQLRIEIFTGGSSDPAPQTLREQFLVKVLTPGVIEVGTRPGELSRYEYSRGGMILCRRDMQEWVRCQGPIEMLMLAVPDQALRAVAEEVGGGEPELLPTPRFDDERVGALMTAIQVERAGGFLSGRLYLDAIAQALAAAIMQARGNVRKPLRQFRGGLAPVQFRRVAAFVQEHLEQDLNLRQLAQAAGLSAAYFSQMFRRSTGVAPHQFVLQARVERAKEMLRKSEARVLDVAVACGFQTQQHFARVFRTFCKVSPTDYRRERLHTQVIRPFTKM